MAAWLATWIGIPNYLAQEWVRVAHALDKLAYIASAYKLGHLCWGHVRLLTRHATTDTQEAWVEKALGMTVDQVQDAIRSEQRPTAASAQEAYRKRFVNLSWDEEDSLLHLKGCLAGSDGAIVKKALERLAEKAPINPETGMFDPFEQRCADALVQIASSDLAAARDPARATVVVHVDVALLASDAKGMAQIEDGPAIAAETAQRLACDPYMETLVVGPDGKPLGIGRKSRQIPAWLRRQLRRRDRCCRFPGCNRSRWLHAHHVEPWAKGGPTDKNNLTLLCTYHHRLVHEGKWTIRGSPDGEVTFVDPRGRGLNWAPPPPLRPDIRARLPIPI